MTRGVNWSTRRCCARAVLRRKKFPVAVFGLESGGKFSEKVLYIYCKQLEEADIIVINKIELLDGAKEQQLRGALAKEFPGKEILSVSARTGAGLEEWFDRVSSTNQRG